jgi:hypothetical protein
MSKSWRSSSARIRVNRSATCTVFGTPRKPKETLLLREYKDREHDRPRQMALVVCVSMVTAEVSGMHVTDELESWERIKALLPTDELGLLVGNGASIAMWKRFGYHSLYEIACDPKRQLHLDACDQKLFEKMDTKNFEAILSALITAGNVWKVFEKPNEAIDDLRGSYKRIRASLVQAVKEIHTPYESITDKLRSRLRGVLAEHDYVFSTNYDLLIYWIMMDDQKRFKDFLWTGGRDTGKVRFDIADTAVWREPKCTKVLFLHGALHLFRDVYGTFKKVGGDQGSILSQFDVRGDAIPLFISEGTWQDKKSAISRNDYLSFAFERFATHHGSLVVFGQSLSDAFDKHLIEAMVRWQRYDQKRLQGRAHRRVIAISMHPTTDEHQIIAEKSRLKKALAAYEVHFFDSTTHPLGDPSLQLDAD